MVQCDNSQCCKLSSIFCHFLPFHVDIFFIRKAFTLSSFHGFSATVYNKKISEMTHDIDSDSHWVLCSCQNCSGNKEVIFPPNGGCLILEGVQFFIPKWFYSFSPYYCKYSSMASLVMEQKIWLSHVHPLGAQ